MPFLIPYFMFLISVFYNLIFVKIFWYEAGM